MRRSSTPALHNSPATKRETARNSRGRRYFHFESAESRTGKATRRETTRGARPARAAMVCERASWACTRSKSPERRATRRALRASEGSFSRRASSPRGPPARASRSDSCPAATSPRCRASACHWPPRISRPLSRCRIRIARGLMSHSLFPARFGVFPKRVERRHAGKSEARRAIQKSRLQEVGAQEGPGRADRQFQQADAASAGAQFFGGQGGVAVQRAEMLGQRIAGVGPEIAPEFGRRSFDAHALVHIVADPAGAVSPVETNFTVGIP